MSKPIFAVASLILAPALALVPLPASAWGGYVTDTGRRIEIESYDHQGQGEGEVEYYDYETGEYKTGYLDMFPGGDGELIDYETGETYDVEME